ncbi:MAG: hypothetical protein WEB19_02650 [Acidimicrobiia bacterium]
MKRAVLMVGVVVAAVALGAAPSGAEPPFGGLEPPNMVVLQDHFEPATFSLDCSTFPTCNFTATGSGILPQLGRSTTSEVQTWTFTGNCGPDTAQFDYVGLQIWTAANGDELHIAESDGVLCVNFVTQTQVFRCTTFTITSGTGRFADGRIGGFAGTDPVTICT